MNAPKLLLTFLLLANTLLAQTDSFTYDAQGLHPAYVVGTTNGMTQAAMYKKALSWAKTGNRTVLNTEEGKQIVFQGEQDNALCFTVMGKKSCNALQYQVAVAFKEGKYKFEVVQLQQYGPINDTGKKGWFPVALDKAPDAFYTRGGDLKKEYVEIPGNIASLFNNLNTEFKKALLTAKASSTDDGW